MPAKRSRKKPVTPPSKIRSVLRRHIWLYSRERREAIVKAGGKCTCCGEIVTGKKGKPCAVHHLDGSGIDEIIDLIYKTLLCGDKLVCMCEDCHSKEHKKEDVDGEAT